MPHRLAVAVRLVASCALTLPLAAQGLCSGSLSLSGIGNYVRVDDHPDLQPANAVTYEAWFYATGPGIGRIVSKGDGVSATSNRTFDMTYGTYGGNGIVNCEFFLDTPAGRAYVAINGQNATPLNTWTHVAATFDSAAAEVVLFLDGVQVAQAATPAGATMYQSTTPLYLGATPPWNGWFEGQINQVRIWDYAWTVNETPFRFVEIPYLPGTTAQWPLDGHTFDLANGHDGEAIGTIGWLGACATWTNYGSGTSGPFGVPTLTSDLPVVGQTMTVQTDNQSGAAALGVLAVGAQPAELPVLGGTLLVDPLDLLTLPIPIAGAALPVAIPNQATLIGLPMFAQLGVFYPGQTQLGFSPGLQWMLGT